MSEWTDAVLAAVRRQAAQSADGTFTRKALMDEELPAIITDASSAGATPHYTMSRELQELRDAGTIAFVDNRGTYRLLE